MEQELKFKLDRILNSLDELVALGGGGGGGGATEAKQDDEIAILSNIDSVTGNIKTNTDDIVLNTSNTVTAISGVQADTTNLLAIAVSTANDVGTIKGHTNNINVNIGTMKADLASVKADTASMKPDTTTIKVNTGNIATDTAAIKADVATVKTDVGTIKVDTGTIKADVATIKATELLIKTNTDTIITKLNEIAINTGLITATRNARGIIRTTALTTLNNGLIYPIIGIRLKAVNAAAIITLLNKTILCSSASEYIWTFVEAPTIVGTAVVFTADPNSGVDVAFPTNATTVTGGKIHQGAPSINENVVSVPFIPLNLKSTGGVTPIEYYLCVQRITGTTETFYASLNILDL